MVAAILAVGGVHAQTQVILSASVLALVIVNALASRGMRWVPFASVALLAVAATGLQLLPLPSLLVRVLSSRAHDLRLEVAAAPPRFMPLSLDVPATILELCKGLAYAGMLLVVARAAARDRRARSILVVFPVVGVVLAAIAGIQRAVHTNTILGVYQVQSLPGYLVFGTFVNSNHAASVLILAALVGMGLAFETSGRERVAFAAAAALSATALFLTLSRAGAVSLVVGGGLLIFILMSRRYGWSRGLLVAGLMVLVICGGVWMLSDSLRSRFAGNSTGGLWDNQKTRGWQASLRLIGDFPITGVGRGAFESPVSAYRLSDEGVRLVYPENLPLQLTSEWGVPITLALCALFVLVAVRVGRRLGRYEPATLSAACGVLAVLLHDLFDFGLELPGVALPAVVALAVVVGRVQAGRGGTQAGSFTRMSPWLLATGGAVWAVAIVAGWWASGHTLGADGNRARDAVAAKSPDAAAILDRARARHPADYYLELLAAMQKMQAGKPGVFHHLNRALRLNPGRGETHALTARWLAHLGRRPQAALEFRLAREHGVATSFPDIFAAIGPAIIEAVPQQAEILGSLSQFLSARDQADAADIAARRAADAAGHTDAALINVIDVAVATGEPPRMVRAAEFVLASNPRAPAVAAAVKALHRAGRPDRSSRALAAALERTPDDPALLLAAARLRLEFGDPAGARELLTRSSEAQRDFHLGDLVELQNLLAQIAERLGDSDAAVLARARGRMFSRRLEQTQQGLVLGGAAPAAP